VEESVLLRHPLRVEPRAVREVAVQAEDRTIMAAPRLIEEVEHPVAAGDVVGVDWGRRPRNEHGDDQHEERESPMGHRLPPTLPVDRRRQTIFTTS
jgi:hypothetical protein